MFSKAEDKPTSVAATPWLFERSLTLPDESVDSDLVRLASVSFAASATYAVSAGHPVFPDAGPEADLTRFKTDTVYAAFTIGSRPIRVRSEWVSDSPRQARVFVRASAGKMTRVREQAVQFVGGRAIIDLPVLGLATQVVGTLDEEWLWEVRAQGEPFTPVQHSNFLKANGLVPVRLYFVAGKPVRSARHESYYHVACAIPGAATAVEAERTVWAHFTGHRQGRPVVNARGQRLGFWRDRSVGHGNNDYIGRKAFELVTETDGSCRSWAELFREALAVHGIDSVIRVVRPRASAVHPKLGLPTFNVPTVGGGSSIIRTVGVLVKPFKWKPAGERSPFRFDRTQYVVNNARFAWKLNNVVDPDAIRWPDADLHDMTRSSHDSREARGLFGNHAVVVVQRDGQEFWYDPSFGFGPHPSLLEYENELFGRGEENPGGLFSIVGWKKETHVNPVTGLTEERNGGILLGAAPAPAGPILEAVDPD